MAAIQIPDELDVEIQHAADSLGRTKDEFVREALSVHIEEQIAAQSEFSEAQIERMKQSLAQLNRGEAVSSEHVDTMFSDWRSQRIAR
jgi:predicted transcriptional regulator